MDNYRTRHAAACQKAFEEFAPDLRGCRKPDIVTAVFEMARIGMFSREIAVKLDITPKAVQKIFRRYNFPRLHNLEPPRREERLGWKGGVKNVNGYLYERTPGHPLGSKHGSYVPKHRLVMEREIGRYLTRKEVVDHIDGNPLNNDLENLRIFPNNGEHLRVTLAGKCPTWSEDGKRRIAEAVRERHRKTRERKLAANHDPS